jgi:hypothetical protein
LNLILIRQSFRESSKITNLKYEKKIERTYFIHSKVIDFLIKSTEKSFIENLFGGKREVAMEKV